MRGLRILLTAVALLFGVAPAHATDPLTGRGGATPAETAAPFAPGLVVRLAQAQRRLNDAISAAFREVRDNGSPTAIAVILGLAFLYGVLHAIGPGHGKAVVASYFVGTRARWTSGIAMGSLISLIQGVTAIVLVGLLAVILQWRQFDVLNRATLVEFVSYGLIALLGSGHALARHHRPGLRARPRRHDHDHAAPHDHDHDHPPSRGGTALRGRLVVAAGLTPCASAIIILLFALANQALLVGVVAVAVAVARHGDHSLRHRRRQRAWAAGDRRHARSHRPAEPSPRAGAFDPRRRRHRRRLRSDDGRRLDAALERRPFAPLSRSKV